LLACPACDCEKPGGPALVIRFSYGDYHHNWSVFNPKISGLGQSVFVFSLTDEQFKAEYAVMKALEHRKVIARLPMSFQRNLA